MLMHFVWSSLSIEPTALALLNPSSSLLYYDLSSVVDNSDWLEPASSSSSSGLSASAASDSHLWFTETQPPLRVCSLLAWMQRCLLGMHPALVIPQAQPNLSAISDSPPDKQRALVSLFSTGARPCLNAVVVDPVCVDSLIPDCLGHCR